MAKKPYTSTSLSAAIREVRALRKQRKELMDLLELYASDCKVLARLASDTPQFSNPIHVIEAKKIRDRHLC
jgi:hypothetical protein